MEDHEVEREALLNSAKELDEMFASYPKRVTVDQNVPRDIQIMLVDFALTHPEEFMKCMGTLGLKKLLDVFIQVNDTNTD
jgi:hypothetical protein